MRDHQGYMVYASLDESTEELVATDLKVGDTSSNPIELGLQKNLHSHFSTRECTLHDCQDSEANDNDDIYINYDFNENDESKQVVGVVGGSSTTTNSISRQRRPHLDHNNENGNRRYLRNRQSMTREEEEEENDNNSNDNNNNNIILPKQQRSRQRRRRRQLQRQQRQQQRRRRSLTQTTGMVRNLVIPIRFRDHAPGAVHYRPLPTVADLTALFNHDTKAAGVAGGGGNRIHPSCPTGSVRDYYLENSHGQFDLQSTIVDWIDSPFTELEIANGDSGYVYYIVDSVFDLICWLGSRVVGLYILFYFSFISLPLTLYYILSIVVY